MTTAPGAAGAAGAEGEVFDLGYRRYDGPREGRWRARRAVWRDGVRTSVGLGRSTGQKVLPILFIVLAFLPAVIQIVAIGFIASFGGGGGPDASEIFTARDYYSFAFFPLLLLAATVAPELLCPDRRNQVITLYLVRPLTTTDYIASRWAAFVTTMLVVLWLPQLLVFATQTFVADDTVGYVVDNLDLLPRIAASGAVYAVTLTTLVFLAASFTDRRAYAAVGMLAIVLISSVAGGIMGDVLDGAAADRVRLVSVGELLFGTNDWIFGEFGREISPAAYVAALASIVGLAGLFVWDRYRRLSL